MWHFCFVRDVRFAADVGMDAYSSDTPRSPAMRSKSSSE